MEPVLTTKNGRIFEIWELLERVCENPGGGHGPPLPPLADAHATTVVLSYSNNAGCSCLNLDFFTLAIFKKASS